MSEWKAKRFWTEAQVVEAPDGFAVELDGRPVRSPLRTHVVMPTFALAQGVADEWQAQEGTIDPLSMPLTRAVNAALDKVIPQHAEVAGHLAEYGSSDLLCYRAAGPGELVERQLAGWDPLLDWLDQTYGARLAVTQGVIPVAQPANASQVLRTHVADMSAWDLTALSELVTLSGSLVLALAVMDGHLPAPAAWDLSRIDESWQIEQWGADEEAAELAASKRASFLQAVTYLALVRQP